MPMIHWPNIQTVLFDMDGTLLDLAFDNFFWREAIPDAWAIKHQYDTQEAVQHLLPKFAQQHGSLNWYSLPFWSKTLDLDVKALKHRYRHKIAIRPGVLEVLTALQQTHKELWLVTNAHPEALQIKLEQAHIEQFFTHIISSHKLGFAKEQPEFWQTLQQQFPFDPATSVLIDDTVSVLNTAQAFGLHCIGIAQPDSQLPKTTHNPHPVLHDFQDLLEGLI